jgi:hypothetical protein
LPDAGWRLEADRHPASENIAIGRAGPHTGERVVANLRSQGEAT